MKFKKVIGQIHLFLGLTSGLVVLILGITGSLYAYIDEISELVYADKIKIESRTDTDSDLLSQNILTAQKALGSDTLIQRITIQNDPEKSIVFRSFKLDNEASGIWYWDQIKFNIWLYMNPYTSDILKIEDQTFEFFNIVFWMHWSLLLKDGVGQPIVGSATLIFIFMLITGLILWWPKNKKARKMSTWFRWKETTKWRRKNYDLHNIVGFYSMFLVVFIALTGLMWAFTWFDSGVQWISNGGKTIKKEKLEVLSNPTSLASLHPLDAAYHYLRRTHPEAKVFYLNIPKDSTGTIGSFVDYADNRKDIFLQFDQYNGELLHAGGGWEEKSNGEKVRAYNYDIHTGAIGGLVGKTIAFFLSLFSASLPVTGFIIWYDREKKKRRLKRIGGTGEAKKIEEDYREGVSGSTSGRTIPNPKPKISRRSVKESSENNGSVLTSNSTKI